MPLHHRRILFSYEDDHGACDPWYGCPYPPPPPPYTLPSTLTPSPSPSPSDSYFPFPITPVPSYAPAPSPRRQPDAGRRNQGRTTVYVPPPGAATDGDGGHHRRLVTNVLAASAALALLSLILFGVSVSVRRRQQRRRRHALLAPAPAATTNVGNDDPEGGGGGGVVHHVWYIRTVGLDEEAIESIAATRYRAGASGLLGAADCSVCLGEFSDGELVRLLPRCGHAFHVPCIDTWLRAHVNCPLCRSDVIDPAATATAVGVDADPPAPDHHPDANANAAAEQVAAASYSTLENEDEDDQEAPLVEDDQHEQQLSLPEPLPQLPCPLPWNVRRAASMDAAMASTAADVGALDRLPEAAPEGEQSGREKDRTCAADGHTTSIERPASGGPSRFFFARHGRARSSVLPL